MVVLIDASIFCAFANTDDIFHQKAKTILERLFADRDQRLVTTDYIFDESVSVVMRKAGKELAKELGRFILQSEIILMNIDDSLFPQAWELFQKTEGFSFTDCSSLAFMTLVGVPKIATFDKGFRNANNIKIIEQ